MDAILKAKLQKLQSKVVRVDDYGEHYASGLVHNDLMGFIELNELLEMEYQGVIGKKIGSYNKIYWFYTLDENSERPKISQAVLYHLIRTNPKVREEIKARQAGPVGDIAREFNGRVM